MHCNMNVGSVGVICGHEMYKRTSSGSITTRFDSSTLLCATRSLHHFPAISWICSSQLVVVMQPASRTAPPTPGHPRLCFWSASLCKSEPLLAKLLCSFISNPNARIMNPESQHGTVPDVSTTNLRLRFSAGAS
eukprot:3932754-Rhodomonas_salina.3